MRRICKPLERLKEPLLLFIYSVYNSVTVERLKELLYRPANQRCAGGCIHMELHTHRYIYICVCVYTHVLLCAAQ